MSDGTLFKPDKDFTKDVDQQIPEAEALAKVCCMLYMLAGFGTNELY